MVIGHATAKLTGRETVQGAIDLIEQYCARGWTDGLPIVPPTVAQTSLALLLSYGAIDSWTAAVSSTGRCLAGST